MRAFVLAEEQRKTIGAEEESDTDEDEKYADKNRLFVKKTSNFLSPGTFLCSASSEMAVDEMDQ